MPARPPGRAGRQKRKKEIITSLYNFLKERNKIPIKKNFRLIYFKLAFLFF
jgi:hypothetical protein